MELKRISFTTIEPQTDKIAIVVFDNRKDCALRVSLRAGNTGEVGLQIGNFVLFTSQSFARFLLVSLLKL